MYSGHLGDQYVSLDALTLAPKKHFSSFRFQLYFKKKICCSSRNGLEDKNADGREKEGDKKRIKRRNSL